MLEHNGLVAVAEYLCTDTLEVHITHGLIQFLKQKQWNTKLEVYGGIEGVCHVE